MNVIMYNYRVGVIQDIVLPRIFAANNNSPMPTKLLMKATKVAITIYAPLQNVGFCISLLCCRDIHTAFTSLPYIVAIDIDAMLLWILAKCFGLCKLYELAILNPIIWTTLMVATPDSWNPIIAMPATVSSAVLPALMINKVFCSKRRNQVKPIIIK